MILVTKKKLICIYVKTIVKEKERKGKEKEKEKEKEKWKRQY